MDSSGRRLGVPARASALGLLLLGASMTAAAQQPPQAPETEEVSELRELSLEELMEVKVVTATALAHSIGETPSTVYVFTEETLKRRGYTTLTQLLEDVPEFEIHYRAEPEWNELMTVRGILGRGNEKLIILLDGFRIDAKSETPHAVGHNFSLAGVERVEVVIGPVSALYGSDAFVGVVQLISKSGAELHGGRVTASIGRFNTTENSFSAGAKAGDISLAVTGSYYHSDEPTLPDFYPDDFRWYNERYRTGGEVHVSPFTPDDAVRVVPVQPYATPTNDSFLSVRLDIENFRFGYTQHHDRHSATTPYRPDLGLYVEDAKWAYTIQSAYGQHTYLTDDERLRINTALSLNMHEVDPDSAFINFISGYEKAFKYEYFLVAEFEEQISYRFRDWLLGTLGFSYRELTGLPKTTDLAKPLDPDASPPELQGQVYAGSDVRDVNGRDLGVPVDFFNVRERNLGSYLELHAQPLPWLTLTAGGRFDHHTRYGDSLTPRLGVVLRPSEGTWLKLLYGEAFLAPSPDAVYSHFGSFTPVTDADGNIIGLKSAFFRLPNPDMKPERLRMGELIVSQDVGDLLRVSANGFLTHIRNRFGSVSVEDQTFKGWPVDVVSRSINLSESEAFLSYGGTLRLDALVRSGKLSVNLYAAYTFTDGETAAEPLSASSKHTGKGGVDVTWRSLSLSTRVIARSGSFNSEVRDERGEPVAVGGSTVVNAHFRYSDIVRFHDLSPSLWVDVRNLLDSRYHLVSASFYDLPGSPQDPLRILVGVDLAF
jgi:outer membrane receptor for ferrienterochelin and colicin